MPIASNSGSLTAVDNSAAQAPSRQAAKASKGKKTTARNATVEVDHHQLFGIGPTVASLIGPPAEPPPLLPAPSNQLSQPLAPTPVSSNLSIPASLPSHTRPLTFAVCADPRTVNTAPLQQDLVIPKERRNNGLRPDIWSFLIPISDTERRLFKSDGIMPPNRKASSSRIKTVEAYACFFCA